MGIEIRRVPAGWEHPRDAEGEYIPLLDGYNGQVAEWETGKTQWDLGFREIWKGVWEPRQDAELTMSFEEWAGERPVEADYTPDWPPDERTHYQLYENTDLGMPVSPVLPDRVALSKWLRDQCAVPCALTYGKRWRWAAWAAIHSYREPG
jgi:hypothetical protein